MSIYNKEGKYIYTNIPRTGCGSICEALKIGGGHWPTSFRINELEGKGIDTKSLFKFAFVRHPYSRFVSAYQNLGKKQNVNEFIQAGKIGELMDSERTMFRPQVDWIMEDDKLLVDFVGRYENLKEDWKYIQKKLKIKAPLPHLNKTVKVELEEASKKVLRILYADDFEEFGYEI